MAEVGQHVLVWMMLYAYCGQVHTASASASTSTYLPLRLPHTPLDNLFQQRVRQLTYSDRRPLFEFRDSRHNPWHYPNNNCIAFYWDPQIIDSI
jgi:hypothetical protein